VNDTYWYLEAVPELLQLATDRLIEGKVQRWWPPSFPRYFNPSLRIACFANGKRARIR
jgi:hypothetical protein